MKYHRIIPCFLLLIFFTKTNAQNFLTRDVYFFAANSINNKIAPLRNDSITSLPANVVFNISSNSGLNFYSRSFLTKQDSVQYTPNARFTGVDTFWYAVQNTQTLQFDTQNIYVFVGVSFCDYLKNYHNNILADSLQANVITVFDNYKNYFGNYLNTNDLGYYSCNYLFDNSFFVDQQNSITPTQNYFNAGLPFNYSSVLNAVTGFYNYFNVVNIKLNNFQITNDSLQCFDTISFGIKIGQAIYQPQNDVFSFSRINQPDTLDIFKNDFPTYNYAVQTTFNTPKNGSVSALQNGLVLYTPNQNFIGNDTFSYTTCYQNGRQNGNQNICNSATVFVSNWCQPNYASLFINICDSSKFVYRTKKYFQSGIYIDSFPNGNGCDSIVTLHLSFTHLTTSLINAKVCVGQSFYIYGDTLTSVGSYQFVKTNYLGCDSLITVHLSIIPLHGDTITKAICSNDVYNFNGKIYSQNGIYYDTLLNVLGCDSIVTLLLSTLPISSSNDSQSICQGDTYYKNGKVFNTAGTFYDTLKNVFNCDSIININIKVIHVSRDTINVKICAGSFYFFKHHLIYNAGTYVDTTLNFWGCDSIITLHLSLIPPTTQTISDVICAGHNYHYYGKIYTQAGNYTDTIRSYVGCDSIVNLQLHSGTPSSSVIYDTICSSQSYNLNGHIYSNTGNYRDTIQNYVGCDSVILLHLKTYPTSYHAIYETICANQTFAFNNQILTQAGNYYDTLINQHGCDSLLTLFLAVYPTNNKTLNESICYGDTFKINGKVFSTAGNYFVDTIPTTTGAFTCDTSLYLNLVVNKPDTSIALHGDTLVATGANSQYVWIDCTTKLPVAIHQKFVPDSTGDYALVISYNNCVDTGNCYHISIVTGIENLLGSNYFKIFPNPTDDKLQIEISNSLMNEVEIIDVSGRILLHEKLNQKMNSIDVSPLPNGLYQVGLMDEQHRTYYQKLSVLHH